MDTLYRFPLVFGKIITYFFVILVLYSVVPLLLAPVTVFIGDPSDLLSIMDSLAVQIIFTTIGVLVPISFLLLICGYLSNKLDRQDPRVKSSIKIHIVALVFMVAGLLIQQLFIS